MAQAKRHILPFFIPHLGCPRQCVFCDQHKIAGQAAPPTAEEITAALQKLEPKAEPQYELAFYGGSFTALSLDRQLYYLRPAARALTEGRIASVRVSTRPDCIDEREIELLLAHGVRTVELGVQSMNDETLRLAGRGHTAEDALRAVRLLRGAGVCCGVQLMPGLPGESMASSCEGAELLLAERPQLLRIYPTVVLRDTPLARLWRQGEYRPLTLEQAVRVSLAIKLAAEEQGARVIRLGLQPSDDLAAQVLAGPYHPAFGALVQALAWRVLAQGLLNEAAPPQRVLYCSGRDISAVLGNKRENLAFYQQLAPNIEVRCADLPKGTLALAGGQTTDIGALQAHWREYLLPLSD